MRILLSLCLASVLACASNGARSHDKLLYVPVHIEGKGPFWFAVDSGASHTVIDPTLAKELGLEVTSETHTTGTGKGEVKVQLVRPLAMRIGNAKLTVQEPWVIDLSGVPIPRSTRGLVGAEWFAAYLVELGSPPPSVRFLDPQKFVKPANAAALPLELTNRRVFTTVTLDVNDTLTVERRVRIDTGSGDAVGDEIVKQARETRETTLGAGLGSDYKALSGRMNAIHLGPFTFRDAWGPGTPFPSMGMEILRRFTVTFDVPRRTLYLVPNAHLADPIPPPPGE